MYKPNPQFDYWQMTSKFQIHISTVTLIVMYYPGSKRQSLVPINNVSFGSWQVGSHSPNAMSLLQLLSSTDKLYPKGFHIPTLKADYQFFSLTYHIKSRANYILTNQRFERILFSLQNLRLCLPDFDLPNLDEAEWQRGCSETKEEADEMCSVLPCGLPLLQWCNCILNVFVNYSFE